MSGIQIVWIPESGPAQVMVGDPQCNSDPCSKHGTCHCMCRCGSEDDNCADCAEGFAQ